MYDSFAFAQEDKEKYPVVLQKFEEHYAPKANVTCKGYKFFMSSQKEGKSRDQYVTALRTLTRTRDFQTSGSR